MMATYRLFHRNTQRKQDVEAHNGRQACEKAGWKMEDVWVRKSTPRVRDLTSDSGYSGGGWLFITPRYDQDHPDPDSKKVPG